MMLHFKKIETSPSIYTGMVPHIKKNISDGKSILMMLEQVMLQVEYHCFTDMRSNHTDPLYKELCLIIAEVLVLDPDSVIKINGQNISVHLVQEVYSQIENNHVELVFINFNNVSQRVFNKKFYLRTALYNSVFEIESHHLNDMICD
jgi:hypothetical protein